MKYTKLYEETINDLKFCYDTHSKKFSSTRKKNRPEVEYIIEKLKKQQESTQKPLSIIEFGCWDWRLLLYIQEKEPNLIKNYMWVDISNELLNIARKNNPPSKKIKRINDDMITQITKTNSESIDAIICLASFQHLPDKTSRSLFLNNIYRVLEYWWSYISIDRSRSTWMIKKHWKLLCKSLQKRIYSLWKRERNNLLIPFKDQWIVIERLYHIFTKYELKKLLNKHWLLNHNIIYSSQNGDFHNNILNARNICTHAEKKISWR